VAIGELDWMMGECTRRCSWLQHFSAAFRAPVRPHRRANAAPLASAPLVPPTIPDYIAGVGDE